MRAPLVLGLGNLVLGDDAVGLELLRLLDRSRLWEGRVDFVDGGTQGLMLLGALADRPAVVVLAAIRGGGGPGTLYDLSLDEGLASRPAGAGGAHEGGAARLLEVARRTGDLPEWVRIVGIEPAVVRALMGLSPEAREALPAAVERSGRVIDAMLAAVAAGAGAAHA